MVRCDCGFEGVRLEGHYRLVSGLATALIAAHYDSYIGVAHLEHMMLMLTTITLLILSFFEAEGSCPELCGEVRQVLTSLPSVKEILSKGRAKYVRVEPLTLSGVPKTKQGAIFFSLYQLVTAMLQESQPVRRHCIAASETWKKGELFGVVPPVYDDLTSGSRFRSNTHMCGKAGAGEENDLRIVVHGWTDAFTTVDGLGVNAREHKYGAFLVALVNMPLRMRHYVDHILMLCLYREQFAKGMGGLCRMLTGTGSDGTKYRDGITLAAELELSKHSGLMIELPNDDADGEVKSWRLRIFFLLISLDWLAAGEFGPFAASVAARRPCGKCMWTADCPCAWRSVANAASASQSHSEHCLRSAPRAHDSVLKVVDEMRAWKGKAAELQKFMTDKGIFSTHFASSFILNDVVSDSTLDIMHMACCGMSRYLISWLTDILIPIDFSWDQLNMATRSYIFPPGVRVRRLEKTVGTPRASKSIHLNGSETLHFTLASIDIMEPLVKQKDHPAWACWKTHVDLLAFLVRHSFDQATGPAEVDKRVAAFDDAFELVHEWKGTHEKPKMHPFKHLSESLQEFGPFRGFWCFSWEGFLQVLKKMFEMTNYKSAAYNVGTFWAAKVVLHYRDPRRRSWYEDSVSPDGAFDMDVQQIAKDSSLLKLVLQGEVPIGIRMLSSVSRGPDTVSVGDWVLVQQDTTNMVGLVKDMIQTLLERDGQVVRVVRMLLSCVAEAFVGSYAELFSEAAPATSASLVAFEYVHLTVVRCTPSVDERRRFVL